MSAGERAALAHLVELVAIDSRNPPRHAQSIVTHVGTKLRGAFEVEVKDVGEGCVSVLATRGAPRVLFNFHLDTVPDAPGWSSDPFALRVENGLAYGLGACDTKGAAAAMLSVALASRADCALLFTTDEEAGQARCVREFCARRLPFDAVVVAEPTSVHAVLTHRGVATGTLAFRGRAAHSSSADGQSATHALVRWEAPRSLQRDPTHVLNVGVVSGGVKPN